MTEEIYTTIRKSNILQAKLVIEFDVSFSTMLRWISTKADILTSIRALNIINAHLTESKEKENIKNELIKQTEIYSK